MAWIALVGPEIEENLSLRYLVSSLKKNDFDAEIVPFSYEPDFTRALAAVLEAETPPLLVGISLAFQWRARDFLALAVALREGGYRGHITLGGHFATFASEEILREFPEVDSIVRQEAEDTMVSLARALSRSCDTDQPSSIETLEAQLAAIAGLALRDAQGQPFLTPHPTLPDLATLPRPDRRGEPATCFGHGIAPLVSSRGCYANCSFCCIASWQEQSLPGKRYRLREVDDVADEMVELNATRGIDIFVFHDDNFFVPGHKRNRERLGALADALEARGIGRYATVVKARPTDVDPEVFRILRERLHCIRVYIGVETDADQGLHTLQRWASSKQNHDAFQVVRGLELYTCFNMLIFDPDTTVESLRTNVKFMRFASEYPSNFGRVELYAGTPLLHRMLQEKRCRGDWMQWDYDLASPEVERIFSLSMSCFHARNFGEDALANRVMGTRFDVEVAKHFHPEIFRPKWLVEGKAINRALSTDTADALDRIIDHVTEFPSDGQSSIARDLVLVAELTPRLRATEKALEDRSRELAGTLCDAIGRGQPLTPLGDRVATPLQTARLAAGGMR